MEFLSFLSGISPWWWVAFGVALGALEMATMSFFLIWPALAALVMGLVIVLRPDMGGTAQIALFAVLSVVLTFAGRFLMLRYGDGGGESSDTLNSRANLMVGRHAEVISFQGPEANVRIDGIRWRARFPAGVQAAPGDSVEVTRADGMMLEVKPVG
jgi:inner membrane protein